MRFASKAGKVAVLVLAIASAVSFAHYASVLLTKYPPVWPDEALFADPAIHLLRDGVMKTELLAGVIPGIERHTYWMPPLYFLSLAAVFRVAGAGLVPMRLFSVAAALAVMALAYGVSRRSGLDKWLSLVPVSLLSVDSVFLRSALVGRMDMLALTLVLLALYLFIGPTRAAGSPAATESATTRQFATGLAAALAFLAHPLGVVAPAAVLGMRTLIPVGPLGRRRTLWVWLLAGVAVPLLGWATYILQEPRSFAAQFGWQLVRKQVRYAADFHAIRDAVALGQSQYAVGHTLVLVVWICGLVGLAVAAEHRPELFVLPLCQVMILAIVLWSNELWYPVYLAPLTAVGLGHMVGLLKRKSWFIVPSSLTLLLCLWFGTANMSRVRTITFNQSALNNGSMSYAAWCDQIGQALPAGSRVLLSIVPDPYLELMKRPDLRLREFAPEGMPLDPARYAGYMASADYIVVGRESPSAAVGRFAEANAHLLTTAGDPVGDGYYARIYKVAR